MVVSILSAVCATAIGAVACEQDGPVAPRPLASVRVQVDTALAPAADAYVRSDQPNSNFGAATVLAVAQTGQTRSLLRFDTAAIRQAVGIGTLDSARLELTITFNDNNWGAAGRAINLHRLTQTWTEAGATWHCADDAVPSNQEPDCSGPTQWSMGSPTAPPFEATASAGAVITNGQSGVVALNVSADVAAVLAGSQTHYGWVLKKAADDSAGQVRFGSRESGTVPRLVLAVTQDTSRPAIPAFTTFFPLDTALWAVSSNDPQTRFYRTIIGIRFDDTTSGLRVRQVLAKYNATIVAGMPNFRAYSVRVPDPGPSFAALDSLVNAISAEPGVDFAFGHTLNTVWRPFGRYPTDGPSATRSQWLDGLGTAATRAWWAVRAPLAWGCENGDYGGPLVDVGVLDNWFDTLHTDLRTSSAEYVGPSGFGNLIVLPDSQRTAAVRSHGTAVAGILAARGDNDSGIAGMIWRSRVHFYAYGEPDSMLSDATRFLAEKVFPAAAAAGVRVLNSSATIGTTEGNHVQVIEAALRDYLGAGQGSLFVQAVGNDNLTYSVDGFLALRGAGLALMQAALRVQQANSGNVLFVAGSMSGSGGTTRYVTADGGSNFISGATEIAAPAVDIISLGRSQEFGPAGLQPAANGTSLAAPFVSGGAALLWAFEPSLSAALVKQYLTRGSREPTTPSPSTGDTVSKRVVAEFPENIFQLDAYGSLVLLARERPGTPICGYTVRPGEDEASVVLESGGPSADSLPVPGISGIISRLSVAQGGRLISVYSDEGLPSDPSVGGSVVIDHRGGLVSPLVPGRRRVFLERDTVDAVYNAGLEYELFSFRRADGSTDLDLDLVASARAQTPNYRGELGVQLSPAGELASVFTWGQTGQSCFVDDQEFEGGQSVSTIRWFRVSVPGGAATQQSTRDYFFNRCSGVAEEFGGSWISWSHDGRAAVAAVSKLFTSGSMNAVVGSIPDSGGGYQESIVTGRFVQTPRFTADDSLVITGELNESFVCTRQARKAATPWEAVGPASPGLQGDCSLATEDIGGPVIPNAPRHPAGMVSAGAAGTAFDLGAPARRLHRARAVRFDPGARVQAN